MIFPLKLKMRIIQESVLYSNFYSMYQDKSSHIEVTIVNDRNTDLSTFAVNTDKSGAFVRWLEL